VTGEQLYSVAGPFMTLILFFVLFNFLSVVKCSVVKRGKWGEMRKVYMGGKVVRSEGLG
jgi:hypothetical protein